MSTTQRPPSGIGSQDFAYSIVETLREPLLILDADLRVAQANRAFYRTFQVSPQETEGQCLYELGDGQWDIPRLRTLLDDILPQRSVFDDVEVADDFPGIGPKVMLLNARRLREAGGERILLAIEDVTERRRLEAERGELETRFTTLIKDLRDHAIFTLDLDGRVTSWNLAAEQVLGYREAETLGQHFAFIFTPQERQQGIPEAELRTAKAHGRAEDERWHLRKGGEPFWALGILSAVQDAAGHLSGYVKILRDRTEHKHAINGLQQSEAKYRSLFEAIDEGFAIIEVLFDEQQAPIDYRFLEMNPAFEQQSGLRNAQGKTIRALVPGVEAQWCETFGRVALTGEPLRFQQHAADLKRWFDVYAWRYGSPESRQVALLFSDITAQKAAAQALQQREQRFRGLVQASAQVLYEMSPDWAELRYLDGGSVADDTKEPIRDWLDKYVYPDDQPMVREACAKAIRTRSVFEIENRVLRPDGSIGWASGRAIPVVDEAGEITAWFGMGSDITARKHAEQAAQESRAELAEQAHALARLNAASSRLWRSADLEQGLQEMLDATIELLGADRGNVQLLEGDRLSSVVHRGFQNAFLEHFRSVSVDDACPCGHALRTGQQTIIEDVDSDPRFAALRPIAREAGFRAVVSTPIVDGADQTLGMISVHFRAPHRPTEQALSRLELYVRQAGDFIARKRTEQALQDSRAQLRTLASELSQAERRERKRLAKLVHDHIQQLIVAAGIHASALTRAQADEHRAVTTESVQRLQHILSEALDATRSLSVELSPPVLDAGGLIGALQWLAARLQSQQQFRLTLRSDPDAEPASDDLRLFLFEAVRELLLNTTKYAGVREAEVVLRRVSATQIEVQVSDQGQGFDPEEVKTRSLDATGFGLFSIRERLAHLGGAMVMESAPGRGTRVRLRVFEPAAKTVAAAPASEVDETVRVHFRRRPELCRVLVVDDHPVVREGLVRLLDVETDIEVVGQASNAAEALVATAERFPDVVVMDVNLGKGMDGIEATRQLCALYPETKVIGLSMHTDASVERAMREAGAIGYLSKDGDLNALIGLIRGCNKRCAPHRSGSSESDLAV